MDIRPRRSLSNPALQRPSALNSKPRSAASLWLDKNENLDPELLRLTREIWESVPPLALATYPEAGELYRKLGQWVGVSPESLLLTPGSDGAIRLTFEAFVEHGEAVIHSVPTFAMYPVYSQIFGAEVLPVEYAPSENGPWLDIDRIIRWLRERKPKLLCLPNPDSPTGTVQTPEVLRTLLTECEKAGTMFLLDEAYHPFHDWSAASWTATSRHLIVARTFAKAWGVAGLRIGYAIAHPETIALLHKIRPMYEVSTMAGEFMSRMLDHPAAMHASVARILDGKAHFVGRMQQRGYRVLPAHGNFVHVAFGADGPAIHAALAGKVLYRAAFADPCLAGFSRFSVAPRAIMQEVIGLIESVQTKSS